jgi:C1A family cysteine protease
MFVLPVWESFYQTESDGRVPMPNRYNESFLGYHAVRAMGWNWESEHYDAFLNSWGPEWGDKGYGYILDGYPIQEMWVITDDIVPHKLTWLDKADEWMRGVWYRLRGLI